MKKRTFGILALAFVGLFAVSMVFAMPFGDSENRDAVREAVESGDYSTWKSLMVAELSEENFNRMVEMSDLRESMREAREAGDEDLMKELMDDMRELMPEDGMGHGMGFGGMGHGMGEKPMNGGCPCSE